MADAIDDVGYISNMEHGLEGAESHDDPAFGGGFSQIPRIHSFPQAGA